MISTRSAKDTDFPRIYFLFGQLWPDKALDEAKLHRVFMRGLSSDSEHYYCAFAEDTLTGFCAVTYLNNFWQEGCLAYIQVLITDSTSRKRGVGSELLRTAGEAARIRGCKKIELDSGFHRKEAHSFYEKNGFIKRAFQFSKDL